MDAPVSAAAGSRWVRPAAVAGTFYPADPRELELLLDRCFADAVVPQRGASVPEALVVPHAGLVYSGPVAASAYLRLIDAKERIRRVVLIGPSHRVPVRGIALSGADAFATPLGEVPVDAAGRTLALGSPQVRVDDEAHRWEHCLEVQLPFLQRVLGDFGIVPLVTGACLTEVVADLLGALWGGAETLVVVSTDLSHYHRYEQAVRLDATTAAEVVAGRADAIGDHDACGSHSLRGLLAVSAREGAQIELLDLRNSGDTAGDRDRVVGYGAFVLT